MRGSWPPLFFAVWMGVMIGWFWQIAIQHDVPAWYIRIPAAYAAVFLVMWVTRWWLPHSEARALKRAWRRAYDRQRPGVTP